METSDFKVEVVEISEIVPHPNADRLLIAKMKNLGWQSIIPKDKFKVGDRVVYIPVDSILPPELEAKLFGANAKIKLSKGRVKAIKIRSFISQGMIESFDNLGVTSMYDQMLGKDLADKLRIVKYEPPVPEFQKPGQAGPASKKKVNPFFKVYSKFPRIENAPMMFQPEDDVVVTEKIHGCFKSRTPIVLADGSTKSIGEIVNKKLQVEVLGMNSEGELIPTKITNWFNNGSNKKWLKIKYNNSYKKLSNSNFTLNCTPNHKFYNPRTKQYVPASELKAGDSVLMARQSLKLNYIQEQVLIGKMLGDGSLSNFSVDFGHKKEHEDYLNYTLQCLGNIAGNKQKNRISGFGTEMVRGRTKNSYFIKELFSNWIQNKEKQVPTEIITQLSPISLAFWYMDDGSLGHQEDQEDRANFATCGFNEESVDNLLLALKKFDINGTKYQTENYWRIRLNTSEAYKMFVLIVPYIPSIMQYKLPLEFRNHSPVLYNLSESLEEAFYTIQEITGIEEYEESSVKYDIETETHNYFANHILVHNSNFRAGWVPFIANTFWRKVKAWLGLAPKWQFVYGSHYVQLSEKFLYDGYYEKNVYSEIVKKYDLENKIPKDVVIYGEIYGAGIQKGYTYGLKDSRSLVVFDIQVLNNQDNQKIIKDKTEMVYIGDAGFQLAVSCIGLPTCPEIFRGKFKDCNIEQLKQGPSILDPNQKVREGIVIKSVIEHPVVRKVVKVINPEYLIGDQTDFH